MSIYVIKCYSGDNYERLSTARPTLEEAREVASRYIKLHKNRGYGEVKVKIIKETSEVVEEIE